MSHIDDDPSVTIEHNGEIVTVAELAERIKLRGTASRDPIVVPARAFALAWLAVCLAASPDKDRPALYRRVNIDVHSYGVTLAATDSYWLARAFVPFDGEFESWSPPTLDEIPQWSFVVADVELRIRDMMRYVERITRKIDDDTDPRHDLLLVITRRDEFDPDVPTLDPSLSAPLVHVEIPGEERIITRESEIDYPNLARLAKFQPKTATKMLFSPHLMGLVSSAVSRIGAPALKLVPTSSGSVSWQADGTTADLSGVLMPLRDDDEEIEA